MTTLAWAGKLARGPVVLHVSLLTACAAALRPCPAADDLRINLWHLDISDQSFNIVDIKPQNMEDLTEVRPAQRGYRGRAGVVVRDVLGDQGLGVASTAARCSPPKQRGGEPCLPPKLCCTA